MSHKIFLSLWFSALLLGTDIEAKVNGVLGQSVTFQVKFSPPFDTISWTKVVGNKSEIIAVGSFKEPCDLLVPDPAYRQRVDTSEDCRELHLRHLKKEDAGRFTAGIIPPGAEKVDESFDLQIFRRLLDSEMKVTCAEVGNGTWKLDCSTGTWEDGVKFSWPSDVQSKNPPLGSSVTLTSHDLNLNVTCVAENPVSRASTTVSLEKVCAEEKPETEAPQINDKQLPSNLWIVAVIVAVVILLLAVAILIRVLMKKAAKRNQHITTRSDIENSPRSDSTLIGNQPKETRRKTNQPARTAAKNIQEMPHTVYAAVQHPKQNPLQTDDEKIQKGRRSHQNQGEKTIYSEITKAQESEDPNSCKTIYETVQSPPSIKSSGP
ncbi:SLAM family member 5-like [Notechis scutatus]|uniref:SLAM family member 5-like n=1 Tax=Notechis scutatus TaxID=8663 RepID=A0A6J1VQ62_9SAUR|nr:SLAM family member 5-like [Notechis scutatus]